MHTGHKQIATIGGELKKVTTKYEEKGMGEKN
jgi:hypothetical protein